MVQVRVLPWLSSLLPGGAHTRAEQLTLSVPEGATVADALAVLTREYPELAARVWDPERQVLRPEVNGLYDGLVLERQGGLACPVQDGHELSLVPAYSGG